MSASQSRAADFKSVSSTNCKIECRTADDFEHVGGRGLLLKRFAQFVEQPRVLNGDDGLGGEVRDQLDLLVGEGTNFLAVQGEAPISSFSLIIGTATYVRIPPSSTAATYPGSLCLNVGLSAAASAT